MRARLLATMAGLSVMLGAAACGQRAAQDPPAANAVAQSTPPPADQGPVAQPSSSGDPAQSAPAAKDTPAAGGAPTRANMAGLWVNEGGECNSGEPIALDPDGAFSTEGAGGTWTLEGSALSITSQELPDPTGPNAESEGPDASDQASMAADGPITTVLTVLSVTGDSAQVRGPDGVTSRWVRCRR